MNDIQSKIEKHPLQPFLPANARLLMLGSFPPPRARWSMEFYYPNLQNDMWRIYGLLFFGDKDYFLEKGKKAFSRERLVAFLEETGVALFDTAMEVLPISFWKLLLPWTWRLFWNESLNVRQL